MRFYVDYVANFARLKRKRHEWCQGNVQYFRPF